MNVQRSYLHERWYHRSGYEPSYLVYNSNHPQQLMRCSATPLPEEPAITRSCGIGRSTMDTWPAMTVAEGAERVAMGESAEGGGGRGVAGRKERRCEASGRGIGGPSSGI